MTTKTDDTIDLGALQREVQEALAEHAAYETAESAARSNTTQAINRLNRAQKALDEAVDKLRKQAAPWNSDWHQRTKEGRGLPA